MVAPRPTSNNNRSFPASTSVAAPNRSVAGNGVPVPSSVTLKSCAQTAPVYAADVNARQIDKIAKRRVMPMSRLHACAVQRAYRATACGVKWARRDGPAQRGAISPAEEAHERKVSGEVAHEREPGRQAADRQRDRSDDVERRKPQFAALVEQHGIERERRKGGVAAEDAGGQEQAPVLRDGAFESEIADQQAHHQRTAHVLEQRGIVEPDAQHARDREVDAMPESGAQAPAQEYDQKTHALLLSPTAETTTKTRLAAGHARTPTAAIAVGVISHRRRFRGTPSPSTPNANGRSFVRQCTAAAARGISAPRWRMTCAASTCAAAAASAGPLPAMRAAI